MQIDSLTTVCKSDALPRLAIPLTRIHSLRATLGGDRPSGTPGGEREGDVSMGTRESSNDSALHLYTVYGVSALPISSAKAES